MAPPTVGETTYTQVDETQATAYIDNRQLLFNLWNLATAYPCLASKIEIRIRQADPREDYAYEESMSDAAIVVTLRWMNTADACAFLRCHATYPSNGETIRCEPTSDPRVYPSGDSTTMTSCEPACFFGRNLQRSTVAGGDVPPSSGELERAKYSSDRHYVMSVLDGVYRSNTGPSSTTTDAVADAASAAAATAAPIPPPDLGMFEYVRRTDTCEATNVALIDYVTQPATRNGGEGEQCRVTNFLLGEDVVRSDANVSSMPSLPTTNDDDDDAAKTKIVTGRLSSSYCAAFAKEFDADKRTCVVPWWETVMSYTFIGSALVRLARHAVHGSDRCDETFPALPSRVETSSKHLDPRLVSRRAWYRDVDRSWVCPPPNVLLSDLKVRSRGEVWTNRNGGTVERAIASDYSSDAADIVGSGATMTKRIARASLQRQRLRRRRRRRGANDDDIAPVTAPPFSGSKATTATATAKTVASSAAETTAAAESVLDFDEIYGAFDDRTKSSDIVRESIKLLAREIGVITAQSILGGWLNRITKSAYNRTLRYVGQRLSGRASRTLVGLGVRIGTARMLSSAMSGLSTRAMLALGTAATGVGFVVAAIEMLAFALDMALVFGWDPGHYAAEMGNETFDAFALAWAKARTLEQAYPLDPYSVLRIHATTANGDEQAATTRDNATDDSSADTARPPDRRFVLGSVDHAPWFFGPFAKATRALVDDTSTAPSDAMTAASMAAIGGGDAAATAEKKRIRPIFADSPVICDLLWTMHYFSHRRFNSNGQRVRVVGRGNDVINVNDAVIAQSIRSNELAAFLNQSTLASSVPRSRLIGAARRNLVAKSARLLDHATAVAGLAIGALCLTFWHSVVRPGPGAIAAATLWALTLTALFVILPITLVPTMGEMIAAADGEVAAIPRRSYDRADEEMDRDDIDALCDDFVALLSNAVRNDDSILGRMAAERFRPELRVIVT